MGILYPHLMAPAFAKRFPELAYLAPYVERYCQGGPEPIKDRLRAVDAAEGVRLHGVFLRLLSNDAVDLQRLAAASVALAAESPEDAERLREFFELTLPVMG